jgi:hypothetical protein
MDHSLEHAELEESQLSVPAIPGKFNEQRVVLTCMAEKN